MVIDLFKRQKTIRPSPYQLVYVGLIISVKNKLSGQGMAVLANLPVLFL